MTSSHNVDYGLAFRNMVPAVGESESAQRVHTVVPSFRGSGVVVMSRVPANVVEVTVETHVRILGQRIKVTPGLTRWIPGPVRKRLRVAYGLA
jgi:hypothetical protein